MELPVWLTSSAKDRHIASLEARITYLETQLERITNSLLQGVGMPSIAPTVKTEMPALRPRMTPSQQRRAFEAQDRKNSLPGEKDTHASTQN